MVRNIGSNVVADRRVHDMDFNIAECDSGWQPLHASGSLDSLEVAQRRLLSEMALVPTFV